VKKQPIHERATNVKRPVLPRDVRPLPQVRSGDDAVPHESAAVSGAALNSGDTRRVALTPMWSLRDRIVPRRMAVGRPGQRRRSAIVAALLLASWALVATSPPTEPTQEVNAVDRVALELTADAPVGLVAFVVRASDEALWSDDDEINPVSGTVRLEAHVPSQGAKPSPTPATQSAPVLGVRLMRDGAEVGVQPQGTALPSVVELDLREACPEGQDCEIGLQAAVEWVNPQNGELAAELVITADAAIRGPEEVPVGAEVSLAVSAPETPEVTVVGDAAASAPVRLDAERPMVTWAVDLSANAEAVSQPMQWPIDPRAILSLNTAVPETAADEYQYRDPPVRLLLFIGDQEMELQPAEGNLQHELPLFLRCLADDEACEEQLTIVAMWLGRAPGEAVTVGWELEAGITFHDPAVPIEGAAVSLSEPARTDLHRDGRSVSATVDGSIPLADEDDPVRVRSVRIDIPARALEAGHVGGPVPAVLAVVTAWSTSSQPIPEETVIRLGGGEQEGLVPFPNQPERSWVVWAAPSCRADATCSVDFGLGASAYRPGGGNLDGSDLVVHWEVEVLVVYPRGTPVPAGAAIDLLVQRP
jgi:hypothetical protein